MIRNHDGQTLIEVAVASSLFLLVVAVLALVLDASQVTAGHLAARMARSSQSRRTLEDLERRIRSARSVDWCPSATAGAEFTTPASSCVHAAEYRGWPPGASRPGGPEI